jgi:hypothetical protein
MLAASSALLARSASGTTVEGLHDDEIGIGGHASIVALESAGSWTVAGFVGFATFLRFAGSLYETDAETWPRVADLIDRGNPKNPLP